MKLLSPEQRRPEGVPSQPARIIERVEVDHLSFALDGPEPSLQVVPQELTQSPSPASEEAIAGSSPITPQSMSLPLRCGSSGEGPCKMVTFSPSNGKISERRSAVGRRPLRACLSNPAASCERPSDPVGSVDGTERHQPFLPARSSRATPHTNRGLPTRYRRPSRPGSEPSLCSHSSPARCIHSGARSLVPARKSNAAPTHRITGAAPRLGAWRPPDPASGSRAPATTAVCPSRGSVRQPPPARVPPAPGRAETQPRRARSSGYCSSSRACSDVRTDGAPPKR